MTESSEKFEIVRNEKFGRYIVAKKDLKPGELILSEFPIILLPNWDSEVCCLNCYDESSTTCRECKILPLCSSCATSHQKDECDFLRESQLNKNILFDNMNIIIPIRCLLAGNKPETRENFEKFFQLEGHVNVRKTRDIWKYVDMKVIDPMVKSEIFSKFQTPVDADMIQNICGIIDVNSFDIRGPRELRGCVPDGFSLRGIYPNAAMLSHHCVSNVLIVVGGDYQLKMFASVEIKKGETIYNNYTNVLFNTADRRQFLHDGKYFDCDCTRCSDPTEFGTNLSLIKCQSCEQGYVAPVITENVWKCLQCKLVVPGKQINDLVDEVRHKIMLTAENLGQLEMLNQKYSNILNPQHSLIIEIKQRIAGILRDISVQTVHTPSRKLLKRKLELCQEILPILRILQPGISRMTGIALYEIYVPLVQLVQREFDDKEIKSNQLLTKLQEGEQLLKESISMLIYEPKNTPEGELVKRAMCELKELRDAIKGVLIVSENESNRTSIKKNRNRRN